MTFKEVRCLSEYCEMLQGPFGNKMGHHGTTTGPQRELRPRYNKLLSGVM